MPTEASPSLDDMLRVLNAATERNTLHWQPTAVEDTFRADFGSGLVRISKVSDPGRYIISLVAHDGTLLD
jgi:hypothetical protein